MKLTLFQKRFLIIWTIFHSFALLTINSAYSQDKFIEIFKTDDGTKYFIRIEKYEKAFNFWHLWLKVEYPPEETKDSKVPITTKKQGHELYYISIDCKNKLYGMGECYHYDPKGKVISSYDFGYGGLPHERIIPESIVEIVHGAICK